MYEFVGSSMIFQKHQLAQNYSKGFIVSGKNSIFHQQQIQVDYEDNTIPIHSLVYVDTKRRSHHQNNPYIQYSFHQLDLQAYIVLDSNHSALGSHRERILSHQMMPNYLSDCA